MTTVENIKRLQEQIELEKAKIKKCNHEFGEGFYNPETILEPYGSKLVTQGSDAWCEPEGYRHVQKDRWTKTCKKCGHSIHTNSTEPVIVGYKPKF